MTTILASKPLIDERLPDLSMEVQRLSQKGIRPLMRVILVGNSPASLIYIRNKKRLCEKVGANFELIHLPETIQQDNFLKTVEKHNNDPQTTGLFIQLPLPDHLNSLDIPRLISPDKDIDGFHPNNIFNLYSSSVNKALYPCTPRGVIKLLEFYKIPISGARVTIIGRSLIVGKPLSLLLTSLNATVTLCHSRTKDIKEHTKQADIIISAVGKPEYFNLSYLSPEKKQVLIDVGINHNSEGKLCGDFDYNSVKDHCSAITPVPGGVGPLTVLSLIENLIIAAYIQAESNE